ncbi:hypothetical protein GIB67_005206, partial [Kingdonia uniflora]
THSSNDEDYVPTAEELERGDDFEGVDVELDDIYSKEEDDRVKTPLEVSFKQLEHSCDGRLRAENTLCNAPWVAREVEALVIDVRAMTPKVIKTRMKTKFGIEISYWTAWNARQICMESIVGSYDQSYNELPSLCVEILKSNPGSIARTWRQDDILQWTGTLVAFRVYLNGFVKRCRPILGLDGYFLKGKYGEVCLSVLSLDANNGLFPIGVYMCITKCKDSWTNFLTKVEPYLSAHPGKLAFISDRLKGLIDSVAEIFPHANHSYFSPYHFVASYVATYSGIIHPISDETHWGSPPYVVDPPPLQRGRGRPRKKRIRDDEVNKVQKNMGNVVLLATIKKPAKQSDVTQVQTTPIAGGVQSSGRASNAGRGRGRSASPPIAGGVQTTPIARGRGNSGRASNAGRGRGRSASTPIAGGVQTTPIAGGRGSSGRASNTGRGRGRSALIPIIGQVQTRSRRAFNVGGVQTRSRKSSNAGRGRGRAMQTNHQRFVDEWLSNSVPVEAPQSQERPPLVIPPMPPRIDASTKPYKKAFKPPRQNWRL